MTGIDARKRLIESQKEAKTPEKQIVPQGSVVIGNSQFSKSLPDTLRSLYKMFKPNRVNYILFFYHRLGGLVWLLSMVIATAMYATKGPGVIWDETPLWFVIPFFGWSQACTAAYYFRHHLPKKRDPGYLSMGDKGRISWYFVVENCFYASCAVFMWFYSKRSTVGQQSPENGEGPIASAVWLVLEVLFVFTPYWWRPLFPKTSLRDSQEIRMEAASNTTADNIDFYYYNTILVKFFYMFAKHYLQFCLNYLLFLNRLTVGEVHMFMVGVLLVGNYMSQGGIFIHTMVFKKIFSNKMGALLYQIGYVATFYMYARAFNMFLSNVDICVVCFFALLINFYSVTLFNYYQGLVMLVLFGARLNATSSLDWSSKVVVETHHLLNWAADAHVGSVNAKACSFGLLFASVMFLAHWVPRLARRLAPFKRIAEHLKRVKPHAEDDPIGFESKYDHPTK